MAQTTAINKTIKERGHKSVPLSYNTTLEHPGDMHPVSRIILLVISLLLLLPYFFPLWDIKLDAPQYPEGLGMQIWINKIGGDLNIINGLNHYIGMKHINPSDFPELTYMPIIIAFLIGLGIISAVSGKKYMLYIFAALLIVLGTVGAIDFYLWEYDYGHNLDPRAAIIVPGMSYQPPLIGSKQLLNFTAYSWPAIGGMAIILTALTALVLGIYELRR